MPIKIRKLEQEAELAYRKLLDVNHDIPAVDYGQAFYDDAVYLRRHRKKERCHEQDQDDKDEDQLIQEFTNDRAFLDRVREISRSDANNPLRKVQELKEAMDHLHHKHAEPWTNKSEAQKAAIQSDFARYDEILRDIEAGVMEIIKSQYVKD